MTKTIKVTNDTFSKLRKMAPSARVTQLKEMAPAERGEFMKYMRDEDAQPVRGRFKLYECPGGSVGFVYRAYKQDNVERYDMLDDQIYTIPLGVAKFLNAQCRYPEYSYVKGEDGVHSAQNPYAHVQRVTKMTPRMGFESLEFSPDIDAELRSSNLLMVETVGI